ncbi:unnamed protein product, partial [Pylaiella littoralis]
MAGAYQGGEQVFPEQTLSGGLQAGPVDAGPADVPPVIQSFEEAENPGASGEIEAASVGAPVNAGGDEEVLALKRKVNTA